MEGGAAGKARDEWPSGREEDGGGGYLKKESVRQSVAKRSERRSQAQEEGVRRCARPHLAQLVCRRPCAAPEPGRANQPPTCPRPDRH